MDFAFSEEQDEFRDVVARFLEERCPIQEVFRLGETEQGYDAEVWKQLSGELGLPGVAIPEAYGGQGFGFLELGIVLEEMGRVLLPSPFFASACVAAGAVLTGGSESQKQELLPGLAAGEAFASLALVEPGGSWSPDAVRMEARPSPKGDGFALDGAKTWVIDAHLADWLLVAARLGEAVELFVVRRDAPGLAVTPEQSLDATRRQGRLELAGTPAVLLGEAPSGGAALARALDLACIGLAAEMAGGAARCLDMAVAYARERRQFGRTIGSFQVIKHKAADLLLEVESARSAAWWACWTAGEAPDEVPEAAALAKACCADAYLEAARENIQIHGGIGFTWEAAPHLFYRRAKVSQVLFGDSVQHRARLAAGMGLRAS